METPILSLKARRDERAQAQTFLVSALLIINRNTNMGAIKQERVRMTHTLFHHRKSYTLDDVFLIQVTLSSRKGQEILQR